MNQSTRKNRFRLLSALYDVAARFTEKELIDLRDDDEGDSLSKEFARIALALNRNVHVDTPVVTVEKERARDAHSRSRASGGRRREAVLREILMSDDLFKGPRDIAASIPKLVEVRLKESRIKYVNRVIQAFQNLSPEEQIGFISSVRGHIEQGRESNFVSRWSKLIRDL